MKQKTKRAEVDEIKTSTGGENLEEGVKVTEAESEVSLWTHHSTAAAAPWSSNHPRQAETPLLKSSSPAQSTLSSRQKILSLASNTGPVFTRACKHISVHTRRDSYSEHSHRYEGSGKSRDIPQSPRCVQVSWLLRLISKPIFKKQSARVQLRL